MNKQISKLKSTQQSYRMLFKLDKDSAPVANEVLADLRVFCNGTKSVFSKDPMELARNAGRQEVFQRIMNFLEVDYADFYQLEDYDIFNN